MSQGNRSFGRLILHLFLGLNLGLDLGANLRAHLGLGIVLIGNRHRSVVHRRSARFAGIRYARVAWLIVGHRLRVRLGRGLRIANLQVVVHLGHARHMSGDRLRQFAGSIARHGSGEHNLALNGGRGDQVALQRLGGIQGMHHVLLNLAVRAGRGHWGRSLGFGRGWSWCFGRGWNWGWGWSWSWGSVLGQRHRAAQNGQRRPRQGLGKNSFEHGSIHHCISPALELLLPLHLVQLV